MLAAAAGRGVNTVRRDGSEGEITVGRRVAGRESKRFKQFKIKFAALVAELSALRGRRLMDNAVDDESSKLGPYVVSRCPAARLSQAWLRSRVAGGKTIALRITPLWIIRQKCDKLYL